MKKFDLSTKEGRYQARKAGFDVAKRKPGKPPKDFWSQVEKTDECWLWTGEKNIYGYGIYRIDGGYIGSHRYVLKQYEKTEVTNKVVMHTCDVRACCNPKHLVVGTHADNHQDKINKNRQAKGEINGASILTEQQVIEIRNKYKFRVCTYKMLADEYNVCKDTIQKVVRKIYWKHI